MKRGLVMTLAGVVLAGLSGAAAARDSISFSITIGTPAHVHVPTVVYHAHPHVVHHVTPHVHHHPPRRIVHVVRPAHVVVKHGHHHRHHVVRHAHRHWR